MLKEQLQRLGMNDKEADTYIALNNLGPQSASTLARITGVNRTSMYDVLNALLEKDIIVSYKQGNNTFFGIDDVHKLIFKEKEKMRIVEEAVETLKEKQHSGSLGVNYYRGIEGAQEMMDDILEMKEGTELIVWSNLDLLYQSFGEREDNDWTKKRIENKNPARILLADTDLAKSFQANDKKRLRETIILPKDFSFVGSTFVYDDYVCMFDTGDAVTGIRIKNKNLADMERTKFEMHWEKYSKKKK